MKKIEYKAPEMEIIKLKHQTALLAESYGNNPGYGGEGDPDLNPPA